MGRKTDVEFTVRDLARFHRRGVIIVSLLAASVSLRILSGN